MRLIRVLLGDVSSQLLLDFRSINGVYLISSAVILDYVYLAFAWRSRPFVHLRRLFRMPRFSSFSLSLSSFRLKRSFQRPYAPALTTAAMPVLAVTVPTLMPLSGLTSS